MIFGLMLAIQFQSIKEPAVRDTRDMWQLREALKQEQEIQTNLLLEIRKYEELIDTYENDESQSAEKTLKETLEELKKEAGITKVTGSGITITIEPLFDEEVAQTEVENIAPDLLKRLLNELNSYGAEHIAISDRRVVNTTVIRDINGQTKMDGYSLNSYPLEIKVISQDAEKLFNRLNGSTTMDNFAIDNLRLSISEPKDRIVIPPYDDAIRIKKMKPVEEGGNL
ncbi:NgoFVII family restriction endonuclease [Bacillus sp. UMB0893]|nr:DUF881 domain-containing protein [Bacillus sp. UMB0893]PLR69944.1 NgoFVII family restriction endonuclease [Bacillus sp. UMB0893]